MDQIIDKTCTRCNVPKPLTLEHFPFRNDKGRFDSWCRECYRQNTRRHVAIDPEAKRRGDAAYRESLGPEYNRRRRERRARMSIPEKQRRGECARKHNDKLKREALEHYGGAFCKCCGETELLMLSLDHINNDGAAHRKALTGKTRTMPAVTYKWAKRNGWPPIYQVMCFNCNWARHWNGGTCPHQLEVQRIWTDLLSRVSPLSGADVSRSQAA